VADADFAALMVALPTAQQVRDLGGLAV